MAGKTDKAKGRVKEAAGALTGNEALKREGKIDQIVGSVKEAVGTAVDTVRDVIVGPATAKKAPAELAERCSDHVGRQDRSQPSGHHSEEGLRDARACRR